MATHRFAAARGAARLLILAAAFALPSARAIIVSPLDFPVPLIRFDPDMSMCGSSARLQLADGSTIRSRLALSAADKWQGLSGLRTNDFARDEALLMMGFNNDRHSIIMRDTYFNLDVFFLDADLKVVGLQRNFKAHPGTVEPPDMAVSEWVLSRHVMEMRANSPIAARIKLGSVLRWRSRPGEKEIERCMAETWQKQNAMQFDIRGFQEKYRFR